MIASCACVQPVQPVKYCIIQQSFRVALNSVCVSLHNQQHAMLLFEVEKRETAHMSQQKPLCLEAVCFLSLQHQPAYLSTIQLTLSICKEELSASVLQCVTIDPIEERVAAGDNTGRILVWNGFKEKVPTLHKANSTAAAVPATSPAAANNAAHNKPPANSDSDSDSDGSEDVQQDSSSVRHQQPMAQPGSSKTQSAAGAGSVVASVAASGKSMQDNFSKLQRCRASVPVTTVHWHAHPVGTLCFSADGTLLLSGGEEAVLVSHMSHAACDCMSLAFMSLYS